MPAQTNRTRKHWPTNNIISYKKYDPKYRVQIGPHFYDARQLAAWINATRVATNPLTRQPFTDEEKAMIRTLTTSPTAQLEAAARFYAGNNAALADQRLVNRRDRMWRQDAESRSYRRKYRNMALPYVEERRARGGLTRADQNELNMLLRVSY
jgi:hypothetical protein